MEQRKAEERAQDHAAVHQQPRIQTQEIWPERCCSKICWDSDIEKSF